MKYRIYEYKIISDISFDAAKSARNAALRDLPFDLAAQFEWDGALIVEDRRRDYGEQRFQALGRLRNRLCVIVFTPREGKLHVISLRKANHREVQRHEAANPSQGPDFPV